MIRAIMCSAFALAMLATDLPTLERDLDHIGRVATVMLDGDLCQRIVTQRAMEQMLHTNPRDKWADADNYDVDDEAFIRTKKMLIRLANLVDYPTDVNLWMPLPGSPARIQIVIRNRHEMSQYWEWGKLYQPMFPDMKQVLDTGRRITVSKKPGFVSVLAPVRNSLGDVVGLVEVVSRVAVDPRENVK
jgi:hypothetical protein